MSERAGGGGEAAAGAGLARLSENEQKLVAKLLSDPTFFPIEFRTWLKQFIEGSGIIITSTQIQGGQGTNIATGLPAGTILPVAASGAVPVDCLICDGAAKGRFDYPMLFERIGVAWGAGDGSTTFNIPDLRDRTLYGVGGRIGIAETDGVPFGSRGGPNHRHWFGQTTAGAGSHSHNVGMDGAGSHNHGLDGVTGFAFGFSRSGSGLQYLEPRGGPSTHWAGDHSHSAWTDEQGGHDHWVEGDTSGGYDQDKGSFAGVIYVISIGTAA